MRYRESAWLRDETTVDDVVLDFILCACFWRYMMAMDYDNFASVKSSICIDFLHQHAAPAEISHMHQVLEDLA